MTFAQAKAATENLVRRNLIRPTIFDASEISGYVPNMSVPALPINRAPDTFGNSGAKHVVDVLIDYDGDVPKELLTNLGNAKKLGEAPVPFSAAHPLEAPYKMSLYIIDQSNGKKTILKHFEFKDKQKRGMLLKACSGVPHAITWAAAASCAKVALKVFTWCMENLGGYQIRAFGLRAPADKEDPLADDNAVDDGFEFIIAEGPRTNVNLKQTIWVTKNTRKTSDSPIANWPRALVEKALNALSAQQSLAQTQSFVPITLADVDPRILTTLRAFYPSLRRRGLVMLSVPGIGKTPVGIALQMSLSRDLNEPDGACYRLSSEMDFFRGESGRVGRGDIFDDGDISAQTVKAIKCFLDVSLVEAATWARWGGCRWVKGQPRMIMDNKVNVLAEPAGDETTCSHEDFMNIISPMFPAGSLPSDKEAVLKRSNFMVQTEDWFYARVASEEKVLVQRVRFERKHWLRQDRYQKWENFLNGDTRIPADFEDGLRWERQWVTSALNSPAPAPLPRPAVAARAAVPRPAFVNVPPTPPSSQATGGAGMVIRPDADGVYRIPTFAPPIARAPVPARARRFRFPLNLPGSYRIDLSGDSDAAPAAETAVKLEAAGAAAKRESGGQSRVKHELDDEQGNGDAAPGDIRRAKMSKTDKQSHDELGVFNKLNTMNSETLMILDSDDEAVNLMDDPNYQRQQAEILAAIQSQPRQHMSHAEAANAGMPTSARPSGHDGGEDRVGAGFLNYVSSLFSAIGRREFKDALPRISSACSLPI